MPRGEGWGVRLRLGRLQNEIQYGIGHWTRQNLGAYSAIYIMRIMLMKLAQLNKEDKSASFKLNLRM